MKTVSSRWAAGLVVLAAGVALVAGEAAPPPGGVTPAQNKLLAMRAAQADALRKLAERVYGLQIDASTTVRDFVAESDEIRTQVKAFIRGAKQVGEPRYYADGACDVDYELTLETIITELKRIADGRMRKGRFEGKIFEQIRQHTKLTVVTVTGSGAPRPDVEAGDIVEGLARGVPETRLAEVRKIPLGWENVTAQGRLMAKRAAEVDAYRQIGERVLGVLVESMTEVKDFVTTQDFIRTTLAGTLVGVKLAGYRYMSDQIAECDVEMTLETITTTVKTILDGKMKGDLFKGDVFQQVMKDRKLTVVTATGRGVPAARFITGTVSGIGTTEPPPWAGQVVKAVGTAAVDQAMLKENEAQAWLNAERAAQLDAYRKIGEEVNGVRIDATTLVKDFVAQHDVIRSDMNTFLQGARIVARRRLDDGTAEVEMELPLERLWLIIKGVK